MSHRAPELIVVGRGTSGQRFLASAATHRLAEDYHIRVIDELGGAALAAGGADLAVERDTVVALDPALHVVSTASGRTFAYDALVLATGMRTLVHEKLDLHRPGCFVYRGAGDLSDLRDASWKARRALVVGSGRLALQAAQQLHDCELETHIVGPASRLLPAWVDDVGGVVLRSRITNLGIEVHLGLTVENIAPHASRRFSVGLSDGSEIASDLVIDCPTSRARDELGRGSGLKLGDREGIAIDERCRTSDPDVFAVGSVASFNGHCLSWPEAREMTAETAAAALAGEPSALRSLEPHACFRALGVPVASFGDAFGRASDSEEISIFNALAESYVRLSIAQHGTKLAGGMLVGDVTSYPKLLDFYLRSRSLPKRPEDLMRLLWEHPRARAIAARARTPAPASGPRFEVGSSAGRTLREASVAVGASASLPGE